MKQILSQLIHGFESIAFPSTCICCGLYIENTDQMICTQCASKRFEDANPANGESCLSLILPDGVHFQDALWRYDKEGMVQEMIRQLKYQGMAQIGLELGRIAGKRIKERHLGSRIQVDLNQVLLVPVPLHPLREKKRGYNQARLIAQGIASQTEIPVIESTTLIRQRNTISQTKFSFTKRMENLRNVFVLKEPDKIKDSFLILVDDVFTTGSTCFSLAHILKKGNPSGMGIFTIAQA